MQAAEALRPVAGVFTFALFAAGVIATGAGDDHHGAGINRIVRDLSCRWG
jgi:hypothetical protein